MDDEDDYAGWLPFFFCVALGALVWGLAIYGAWQLVGAWRG